jgi:signal transduction histidine kinase
MLSIVAVLIGLSREDAPDSWPTFFAFAAAAALAGGLSVRSSPTTALSLDMPILLAGGLVFGPSVGAGIALVSFVDPREWRRETSFFRAICNRGQTALSVLAGSVAFVVVGGELGNWPGSLAAGLVALATDISINYLFVAVMTSLRTGASVGKSLSELRLGQRGLFAVMYAAYGLMSVLLAEATAAMGLQGFVAFAVPLALAKGVFEQSRQVFLLRRTADRQRSALNMATQALVSERQDERHVLAGELHDEVLPPLFKVHLMGQVLRQDLIAGRLLSLDDDLPELLSATETAQTAIRDVVRGLRAAKIGPGGLTASLRLVAEGLESSGAPRFDMRLEEVSGSAASELLCYQLIREAMNNAAKHSKASTVRVDLSQSDSDLCVVVTDDGVGFDLGEVNGDWHFGLSLVAERVAAAGGEIGLDTGLGRGTVVRAVIPAE